MGHGPTPWYLCLCGILQIPTFKIGRHPLHLTLSSISFHAEQVHALYSSPFCVWNRGSSQETSSSSLLAGSLHSSGVQKFFCTVILSVKDPFTSPRGKALSDKQVLRINIPHCLLCLSGSLKPYRWHLWKLLLLSCPAFVWLGLDFLDLWQWLESPVFGNQRVREHAVCGSAGTQCVLQSPERGAPRAADVKMGSLVVSCITAAV